MDTTALQAQNVRVTYDGHEALKGVTLDIPRNQITALIGASGSGKSTFLRTLNRMHDVTPSAAMSGSITFNGHNILDKDTDVIELRTKIGMVFQHPVPFPKSTFDNVAYGLRIQGERAPRSRGVVKLLGKRMIDWKKLEASTDRMESTVVQSLKDAALWDEVKERLHLSALRLSGGQKQRLCIARMIAVRPDVLLLDEPCSALDPISTRKIEDLLMKLKEKYTIVIVTHNMQQAKRIADYTGFFHMGELVEFDATKKIFEEAEKQLTRNYVKGYFG
ncbi:phosphate ABC transporter ATP-binding protein [Candidatus Kaiserbacteria bacterium]|nr:phosphate ABC transporter ATP-binding protein [Candidatus Kaiserbacteria bacterium]